MLAVLKERQAALYTGLEYLKLEKLWRNRAKPLIAKRPGSPVPPTVLDFIDRHIAEIEARLRVYTALEQQEFNNDFQQVIPYLCHLSIDVTRRNRPRSLPSGFTASEAAVAVAIIEAEWDSVNTVWVHSEDDGRLVIEKRLTEAAPASPLN